MYRDDLCVTNSSLQMFGWHFGCNRVTFRLRYSGYPHVQICADTQYSQQGREGCGFGCFFSWTRLRLVGRWSEIYVVNFCQNLDFFFFFLSVMFRIIIIIFILYRFSVTLISIMPFFRELRHIRVDSTQLLNSILTLGEKKT